MLTSAVTQQAFELPTTESQDLARRIMESVITPDSLSDKVKEGMQRIDDVASGKVEGYTEEEFRKAFKTFSS